MTTLDRLMANRWHVPLFSETQAREFIQDLVAKGLSYHPDDPAADIVCDGKPLFTEEEAEHLDQRMAEVMLLIGDEVYDILTPARKEDVIDSLRGVQEQLKALNIEQGWLLTKQAELLEELAKLA